MSKQSKTAAELMAELQGDPNFREQEQRQERKRLQREQEYVRLFEPLLVKLRMLGLKGTSLQEMVQNNAPFSAEVVEALLTALSEIEDVRAKEVIVRALGAAKEPFDGRSLTACYDEASDEGLRFAVLNSIALVQPHSINDWVAAIRNTPAGAVLRKLSEAE